MPDDRWDRMWELFHEALQRPPAERSAFLDVACAGDDPLRRELESLIASQEGAHDLPGGRRLLDQLAAGPWGPDRHLGRKIGPYRLENVLGEGGMGVVYAAEQEEPIRRSVALKLVRFGLDAPDLVARFQAERQILAMMDHPNIAAIHDAGITEEGRPYFVMELVQGVPITAYADEARLTPRDRLDLFIPVCRAVQHAHQKGVIHRDLKPSNVLVVPEDGRGCPKIIDFGIAKLAAPQQEGRPPLTAHGAPIGTPEYMSPEQSERPHDVDTRADVYSLGVLLYELLAGAPPPGRSGADRSSRGSPSPSAFVRSLGDDARRIAELRLTDPVALRRHLQGELDWIVLKAIEPDRQRRYQTVSDLAGDVERYLANQPLSAGPPGAIYRARKFVARHRLSVSAAAALALLLAASAIVTAVLSARLAGALAAAERELKRSQLVSSFMVELFRLPDPYSRQGQTVTARELLDRQARLVEEELADQPEVQAALMNTLGRVYQHLGAYDRSASILKKALASRLELLGEDHLDVAESRFSLGLHHLYRHEYAEAEPLLQRALEVRRSRLGPRHDLTGMSLRAMGELKAQRGDLAAAEALLQEGLAIHQSAESGLPGEIPDALVSLANVAQKKGDWQAAVRFQQEALSATPPRDRLDRARILSSLGGLHFETGRYAQAEPAYREALAIYKEQFGDEHPNVAFALGNVGLALHHLGDHAEAGRLYGEALAMAKRLFGERHGVVANQLNNLALLAQDTNDDETAERLFRQALEMRQAIVGAEHADVAYHVSNLARVLHHKGDHEQAEKLYRRAIEIRRKTLPERHPQIATTSTWLGRLLVERGDTASAEPILRDALDILRQGLPPDDWRTAEAGSHLGGCLMVQGRYEEAEPLLVGGYTALDKSRGTSFWRTREALDRLIALYEAWGRTGDAAAYRARRPSRPGIVQRAAGALPPA